MASEKAIVESIKRKLNELPHTRVKKLWSSAANRDIDILVVTHGLACFYEIKQPGETPTAWQLNRLDYWRTSAADVGWFDNADECYRRVRYMADQAAHYHQSMRNFLIYLIPPIK